MPLKPNKTGMLFCMAAIFLSACNKNASKQQAANNSDIAAMQAYDGSKDSAPVIGNVKPDPKAKDGLNIIKYKDGVIKAKGNYSQGLKDGEWQSFYESGKLWSDEFFSNGLPDGKITVYYENGQVMYKGQYKEGKPTGNWTYYNQKGEVIRTSDYDKKAANTAL